MGLALNSFTFVPRQLLCPSTSSSSSGTQCRSGARPARDALLRCGSTGLHMLDGSM